MAYMKIEETPNLGEQYTIKNVPTRYAVKFINMGGKTTNVNRRDGLVDVIFPSTRITGEHWVGMGGTANGFDTIIVDGSVKVKVYHGGYGSEVSEV
jgi:hypothetical protein